MTATARQQLGILAPLDSILLADTERPLSPAALSFAERLKFDIDGFARRIRAFHAHRFRYFVVSFPDHERSRIQVFDGHLMGRLTWLRSRVHFDAERATKALRVELEQVKAEAAEAAEAEDHRRMVAALDLADLCRSALARLLHVAISVVAPLQSVWGRCRTLAAGGQSAHFAPLN